jgi:hypothetical protein
MRLAEMRASVFDALQACNCSQISEFTLRDGMRACRSESLRTLMRKPMKHIIKETCVFEQVRFPV